MIQTWDDADNKQVGGTHYKDLEVQPWSVMEVVLSPEEFRGYLLGNVIKYAMRQGKKDSDDAGKANHYIQKYYEHEKKMHEMRTRKTRV